MRVLTILFALIAAGCTSALQADTHIHTVKWEALSTQTEGSPTPEYEIHLVAVDEDGKITSLELLDTVDASLLKTSVRLENLPVTIAMRARDATGVSGFSNVCIVTKEHALQSRSAHTAGLPAGL